MEPIQMRDQQMPKNELGGHQSAWDVLYKENQILRSQLEEAKQATVLARQGESRAEANYKIASEQLCNANAARQGLVEEIVEGCVQRLQPQFTPELLQKIAAHVEPKPPATAKIELAPNFIGADEAELRERLRCAAILGAGESLTETMQKILSGFDPFLPAIITK